MQFGFHYISLAQGVILGFFGVLGEHQRKEIISKKKSKSAARCFVTIPSPSSIMDENIFKFTLENWIFDPFLTPPKISLPSATQFIKYF